MRTHLANRLRVAGSLGVLLTFALLSSAGIPAVSASNIRPSGAELQEAMDMREALGFPADLQTVTEMLQSDDASFDFGGPLSEDEHV